jgi:RNA polymerase sigma-70 factor (ECF subfamily)
MDEPGETVIDPRTESALVEELRAGSPEALTALFDRYGDRIHTHCFRQLGSWHEAEDATATVFLEVWRHRQRVVEHDGSAVPWLYGVATNVCRNLNRRSRRHLRAVGRLPGPETVPDHATEVTDRLDAEARMNRVLSAIEELPRREREVLALVAWAGLTYEQAAAALAVPVGTVRSRLSRARKRLSLPETDGGEAS